MLIAAQGPPNIFSGGKKKKEEGNGCLWVSFSGHNMAAEMLVIAAKKKMDSIGLISDTFHQFGNVSFVV